MNSRILLSTFLGAIIPYEVLSQETGTAKQTLSLGLEISSFNEETLDEDGTQVFAPLHYTFSNQRFDFGVKTAFLHGERKSSHSGGAGSVSSLSDTAVSASYRAFAGDVEWLGGRRATLALNTDINLPTGQEQLSGSEKNAVFDGFIVDHDRYGEGLNFGIGLSSTITLDSQTLLGFGFSYNIRGDYSPDGDQPDQELAPGNHKVASIQLLRSTPQYQWNLGYRVIDEDVTKVNGVATYDRATSHEIFASGAYAINDIWSIRSSASLSTRGADSLRDATTGALVQAERDDNGDSSYFSVGVSKRLSERDTLSLDLSRRYRAANDFDESNFSFAPSLERKEIRLGYQRSLNAQTILEGSLGYFEVEEGTILGFSGPKYEGFTLSIGVSHEF
ncbi:hypothetical protein GG681_10965 [Epibacterium sp. SM1969]|uniref:Beta-barrel porin 2 n=1 Tax=Tritonibacter aquimaris TaxID=2663379 RepID=A0A844AYZ4_9RHOB|nr:hypothetical protein [Tritonibacter aquimaris]MQY43161.1 hypothetical protein [Tritonibacter aquimaris]